MLGVLGLTNHVMYHNTEMQRICAHAIDVIFLYLTFGGPPKACKGSDPPPPPRPSPWTLFYGAFHLVRTHLGGGGGKSPIHVHCLLHAKMGGGGGGGGPDSMLRIRTKWKAPSLVLSRKHTFKRVALLVIIWIQVICIVW